MTVLRALPAILTACLLVPGGESLAQEGPCPQAAAAEERGEMELALESYEVCLETGAMNTQQRAEAHEARGRVFLGEGRLDCALSKFDEAIFLAPRYAAAYLARGEAYLAKALRSPGDVAEGCRAGTGRARPAARGGIIQENKAGGATVAGQSFPDKRAAQRWLDQQGQIAALQRQVAALERQLAKERAAASPRSDLLPLSQAPLTAPGEAERGLADFSRALELDPDLVPALFGRAAASCRLGQGEDALADWGRGLALAPELARRVQAELAAAAFYDGQVDGDFGPRSQAALAAFADARCR